MRIKKHTLFAFVLLAITPLLLLSCYQKDQPADPLLRQAESVMDSQPDSAYLLLKSADPASDFSPARQAEWNLLITQAMDKAYMEHTTDSLIHKAMVYYEKQNNPDRLILAYYYMGRVSQDLGDAPRAQEYYQKALEIKPNRADFYLLALINSHIGSLYTRQRVYDKALPYLQQACDFMEKANNSRGLSYVLRDIGRVYHLLKDPDQSIAYYKMALDKADQTSRSSILTELSACYVYFNKQDSAYFYLHEALVSPIDSIDYYATCLTLGKLFVNTNVPDSALHYLFLSERSEQPATRASSIQNQMKLARQDQDWKKYADLHTRYVDLEKEITAQKHTESIRMTEQLYNYRLLKKEGHLSRERNQNLKTKLTISFMAALAILISGGLLVCRFRKKNKEWEVRYKKMTESHQMEKERFQYQLEHILKEATRQNKKELYEKEILDLRIQHEKDEKTIKKGIDDLFKGTQIYQLFRLAKNFGQITQEEIDALFNEIDILYPNFQPTIRICLPEMTDVELHICYFLKADIGNTNIGRLMSLTKGATGMRKNRILKKIQATDPTIADLKSFLDSIC